MQRLRHSWFCVKKFGYYLFIASLFHFVSIMIHYIYLDAFNRYYKTKLNVVHFSEFKISPWNETDKQQASQVSLNFEPVLPFSQNESHPTANEQFTVIILTYKRLTSLKKSLVNLNGLRSVNKTIVVWNDVSSKPPDFKDITLTYPVEVVVPKKNSLNNRFFIYEQIQTDAILSLDDDVIMDHGIINYIFRVWQTERYSIVGTVNRGHFWDDKEKIWKYCSSKCFTSIILLGAAFYHKIFNYAYRTWMSKKVLKLVDEIFNCEDIAMNFLVANITKRPPVRVGDPVNAYCYECKTNLSTKKDYGEGRRKCMQVLPEIYGFMPLKYTYLTVSTTQMHMCPLNTLPNTTYHH